VSGAGAVSIASGQSGLTCTGCTLAGTTTLPGGGEITGAGLVGIGVDATGGSGGPTAPLVVDSALNPLGVGSGSLIIQGDSNKERIDIYSAGASPGPAFQGKGFGGTVPSPTATTAGMSIFILGGGGYTGSALTAANPATIKMNADDNWSPSDTGTNMTFSTTPDGATSAVQRAIIANNGDLGIGTATPGYLLDVEGGPVNASGGFVAAGAAGVSCPAGTGVAPTVTDGIVTACGAHDDVSGTAPTPESNCGTGFAVAGNDNGGRVVLGAAPGSYCMIDFAGAWTNTPVCTVGNESSGSRPVFPQPQATKLAIVSASGSLVAGDSLAWICRGYH
jgi:hypothetical protein